MACSRRTRALCLVLLSSLLATAAASAVVNVQPSGGDTAGCGSASAPCKTLKRALAEASAGDTISLAAGVYFERDLEPGKPRLSIVGAAGDPASVVLDGGGEGRIMALYDAAAGARISGLTFRNGKSWVAGCLLLDMLANASAGVLIERVVFENCLAVGLPPATTSGGPLPYVSRSGGALYAAKAASPTLRNVVFRSCQAWLGGGGVWTHDDSAAVFEDCLFESNKADNFGGGLVAEGRSSPIIRRSRFIANESPYGGGVDSGLTSTARFEDCVFERNVGTWSGGAIYHYGDDRYTIVRSVFRNNRAGGGGGGAVAVSTTCAPVYEDCLFEDSTSESGGGHVTLSGQSKITVRRSVFRRSTSTQGGAFYNRGETTAVLEGVQAEDGVATDWGGGFLGIWGDGNTVTIRNSSFAGFSSRANPGGFLRMQGDITVSIEGSLIANCTASAGVLQASDYSVVTIRDTVISDNRAGQGGAIAVYDFSSVEITGGALLRNEAKEQGGALFVDGSAQVTLRGTTVAENGAKYGGGLYVADAAAVRLLGATFARNRAKYGAAACVGPRVDGGGQRTLEANGTTFEGNAAEIAGGVVYYDSFSPILSVDPTVQTRDNVADWGPISATRPQRVVLEGDNGTALPSVIERAPGESFVVAARLTDALGQLVTSTYPPLLAELRASPGIVLNTLTPIQVFKRGTVAFQATYYVEGSSEHDFTLSLESDAGAVSVELSVSPCIPGFSAVRTATSFRCLPCAPGTYNLQGDGQCLPCPSGAACPGKTLILPEKGFWVEPNSLLRASPQIFRCPSGLCCPEGKCTPDNACAEHRTGILCGQCLPGYSDWAGRCARCESPEYALLLVPVAAAAILVVGCWLLSSGLPSSGKVKSAVFFVQAVALVMNDDVGALFSHLSWDVVLASPLRCPFQISPVQRTLLGYWIPAFAFLFMCMLVGGILLAELARSNRRGIPSALQRRLFVMAFQIASIAYIAIGNTSIKFLDCVTIGDQRVLRRFPSVNCASDEYSRWLPVAWIMMVGYVFALPVALVVVVLHLSRRGTTALYSEEVVWKYGVVFACYRPPWKFYEVVVMARRIVLIALDTAFAARDNARALALFLAAVFFVTLHGLARPYRHPLDNVIETLFLTVLMLCACLEMVVSAAFIAPEYNVRGVQYAFNAAAFAIGVLLIGTFFLRRALAARGLGSVVAAEEEGEDPGYRYLAGDEEDPPPSHRSDAPPLSQRSARKRDGGGEVLDGTGLGYAPPTVGVLRRRNSHSVPEVPIPPPAPPSIQLALSSRSSRSSRTARSGRAVRTARTHRSSAAGSAANGPASERQTTSPARTSRSLSEERSSDGQRALPVLRSIWEMTAPPRSASGRSLKRPGPDRELGTSRSAAAAGPTAPAPATEPEAAPPVHVAARAALRNGLLPAIKGSRDNLLAQLSGGSEAEGPPRPRPARRVRLPPLRRGSEDASAALAAGAAAAEAPATERPPASPAPEQPRAPATAREPEPEEAPPPSLLARGFPARRGSVEVAAELAALRAAAAGRAEGGPEGGGVGGAP